MAVAAKSKKTLKPVKAVSKPKAQAATKKPAKAVSPAKPVVRPQPAPPIDKMSPRLQRLIDKSDVEDVIHRFCRALDRMDETLLRSVCHMDASIDLGPGVFQGLINDYVPWVLGMLAQVRSSHNMVGGIRVEIEGDVALVETYVQTYYRLDKPTGREDLFIGGRFLDRMERRPAGSGGVWKIAHRKHVLDWTRTEIASDLFYHHNPDALWSYRSKTDPSYQMAQFPGSQNGSKLPVSLGRKYDSKSVKI